MNTGIGMSCNQYKTEQELQHEFGQIFRPTAWSSDPFTIDVACS